MPAKSEAQRRLLNARFGHAWVKAHGFGNAGKLPARVGKKRKKPKKRRAKAVRKKSKKKPAKKGKKKAMGMKRKPAKRRMY